MRLIPLIALFQISKSIRTKFMERYSQLRRRCQLGATAIAITLVALFNSTVVQASEGSQPVTVHQHVNFNGRSLSVGEGEVTIQDLRSSVGNDQISSIRRVNTAAWVGGVRSSQATPLIFVLFPLTM